MSNSVLIVGVYLLDKRLEQGDSLASQSLLSPKEVLNHSF
jgi:hypothetical protein